ncbi:MAG TPA: hypothetical protein VIK89_00555 [Cytophagaceae bacterium]
MTSKSIAKIILSLFLTIPVILICVIFVSLFSTVYNYFNHNYLLENGITVTSIVTNTETRTSKGHIFSSIDFQYSYLGKSYYNSYHFDHYRPPVAINEQCTIKIAPTDPANSIPAFAKRIFFKDLIKPFILSTLALIPCIILTLILLSRILALDKIILIDSLIKKLGF